MTSSNRVHSRLFLRVRSEKKPFLVDFGRSTSHIGNKAWHASCHLREVEILATIFSQLPKIEKRYCNEALLPLKVP